MNLTFKDKIELEKYYGLMRIWFYKDGIKRTFYIQGTRAQLEKLSKVKNYSQCKLTDYGEVMATYEGDIEPESVKVYIDSILLRKAA